MVFIAARKGFAWHYTKTFAKDENLEWRKQTSRGSKWQVSSQTKPNHFHVNTLEIAGTVLCQVQRKRQITRFLYTDSMWDMFFFLFGHIKWNIWGRMSLYHQHRGTETIIKPCSRRGSEKWWSGKMEGFSQLWLDWPDVGFCKGQWQEIVLASFEEEEEELGQMSNGGAWDEVHVSPSWNNDESRINMSGDAA